MALGGRDEKDYREIKEMSYTEEIFDIKSQVAVITGAGGYLCSEMAFGLAKAGAKIAVLDLRKKKAQAVANQIIDLGGEAIAVEIDVANKDQHIDSLKTVLEKYETKTNYYQESLNW